MSSDLRTEGSCDVCQHWKDAKRIEIRYLPPAEDQSACDRCKFARSVYRSIKDDLLSLRAVDFLLDLEYPLSLKFKDDGIGLVYSRSFRFDFKS